MREHCDMYSPQSPNLHVIWCCKLVTWPWVVGNLMGTTDIFLLIWTTFYLLRTFYSLEREERDQVSGVRKASARTSSWPRHWGTCAGLCWSETVLGYKMWTQQWGGLGTLTHVTSGHIYCIATFMTALVTRISKKLCSVTSHLTWLVVCSITSRCAGCHAVMLSCCHTAWHQTIIFISNTLCQSVRLLHFYTSYITSPEQSDDMLLFTGASK